MNPLPRRLGIELPIIQAPMAGVSVQAFRRQGRRFGAGLVCSEMVSCAGIEHRNERTLGYLRVASDEHPLAIQIFGSEPRAMAEAARMVEAAGADIVDMNFGCPVRKVTKTGAGAHLIEDPELACAITAVRELAEASGRYPILSEWMAHPRVASPTAQFELSLSFLLDGIAARLRRRRRGERGDS